MITILISMVDTTDTTAPYENMLSLTILSRYIFVI